MADSRRLVRERERKKEMEGLDCEEVDEWLQQTLAHIRLRLGSASFDAAGAAMLVVVVVVGV